MTFDELKEKALTLPYEPGVYIMRDKHDRVIYVGKAKKLKNRVTQYFQDTAAHTPKTRLMVSRIHDFDVIVAASEFEALVLECSLIKRHMPKYNILLKDDKGYPYLRLNMNDAYPRITLANKIADDGAEYFGPFGSRGVSNDLIEALRAIGKLPNCNRRFPRDVGKDRPCLNYHMNQCEGWCQKEKSAQMYRDTVSQIRQLLLGNYKKVAQNIREEMLRASEQLEFERAAKLRDRLNAVESLGKKQLVTASAQADTDVIGFAQTAARSCFTVLHYNGGNLIDKDYEILSVQEDPAAAVTSLLKQYYLGRGYSPKTVLLPFPVEDAELLEALFEHKSGRKTKLRIPKRGDNAHLVELACKNAREEAERASGREEKESATLVMLTKMLGVKRVNRIESFDISNIAGTDIVAGMVAFVDGKPSRKDYKRFKIEGLSDQDDYASMRQTLERRFRHYLSGDEGFDELPDVLLIDGGMNHATVAEDVLRELGVIVPVFGMVKDDRHRTRALITADGREIRIDNNQSVFSFVGAIQEEVHRFAISYHRKLRSKRLQYSELDKIPGIGPKRKQDLLKAFKSLTAIREADRMELERWLPRDAAVAVYQHFHEEETECE